MFIEENHTKAQKAAKKGKPRALAQICNVHRLWKLLAPAVLCRRKQDIGEAIEVGKLVLTVMAAIAEFENKRRSERQKAAFKVMRGNGHRCGALPYGWDAIATGRTSKTGRAAEDLTPNEYEQLHLRSSGRFEPSTSADLLRLDDWRLPHKPRPRSRTLARRRPLALARAASRSRGAVHFHIRRNIFAAFSPSRYPRGAHPSRLVKVSDHFAVELPYARAINPITHTNWEETCVLPDIEKPTDQALDAAYWMAVEKIVETTSNPRQREQLQRMLDEKGKRR